MTEAEAADVYLGRGTRSIEAYTALPWTHTGVGGLIKSATGECVAIICDPPRWFKRDLWNHTRVRGEIADRIVSAVNGSAALRVALRIKTHAWRRRATTLTNDREVTRDDRIKARILRECAGDVAALLSAVEGTRETKDENDGL